METITSALNQVEGGEIVLPAIQRDFVWSENQILRLLDSILRGYPIGLLLLWETYADIQYRSFVRDYRAGNLSAFRTNPQKKRVKLVLDGQQRLQSLYVALYGSHEGRQLYFDVLSGLDSDDLSEERFLLGFFKAREASEQNRRETDEGMPPYLYVKTSDLFRMTGRQLQDFRRRKAARLKLPDEWAALLEENVLRFKDELERNPNIIQVATVDANLMSDDPSRKSEADVVEIFVRVNTEGTRLNRADLIFSLLKLNWRESAEALPEFVRTINQGNDLGIQTDFVIRCLFAVSDLGAKMDLDLLRKRSNVSTMQSNFEECCDAIRAAVDFVVHQCKCQSPNLVGGLNTLVPFVYYLFHSPEHEVPNREVRNMRAALYLFAFARTFSRYGESRIGRFIRRVLKPRIEGGEFAFPLEEAKSWIASWDRVTSFDLSFMERNADLALHLAQGLATSRWQYSGNAPEIDHIFPKSTLFDKGHDPGNINTIANYWILARGKNRNKSNRPPREYFADVDDETMRDAMIPRDLLTFGRYQTFLRRRGQEIEASLQKRLGVKELVPEATADAT